MRRRLMLCAPLVLGAGSTPAQPQPGTVAAPAIVPAGGLPPARSLRAELDAALARGHPLVVMASLPGCPWCRIARENYLVPMGREGRLSAVQVDHAGPTPVERFDGSATTHGTLLSQWSVQTLPTLLFFGRGGREAAPRLEGVALPDYYGAYLEQRLREAARQLA